MKGTRIYIALILSLITHVVAATPIAATTTATATATATATINPVVGDQSFVWKYGHLPSPAEEDLRIATHLEYAEFLLRSKDVSHLPPALAAKRKHTLDLLHEYWTRGSFPQNADYINERRPCFIDQNGTICAVGYLVEQTAGRSAAEYINARHQYEEIMQMNDALVYEWIESSGLTLEECATIQPTYEHQAMGISAGVSYRVADDFYPMIGIYGGRHNYKSDFLRYSGYGVEMSWLRDKNFALDLRFAHVWDGNGYRVFPALGFKPECFVYNSTWGMNLYPEFGCVIPLRAFSLHVNYSYAIPVVAADHYGPGRHAFMARLQWSFDVEEGPHYRKANAQGAKF